MKKNINLKVLLCLAVTLCTIFVMFSACTETGENQTSEPSADIYADPTEKATIVPITLAPSFSTPCPTPPAEATHDVELLSTFFDTPSKVEGKTNGELLFKNYNSDNPYTWHVHNEAEHEAYVEDLHDDDQYGGEEDDEFLFWIRGDNGHRDYNGYVEKIDSSFLWGEKILNFGGTLLLDGFNFLERLKLYRLSADELRITGCENLRYIYIANYEISERWIKAFDKVYIDGRCYECDCRPCAKEFRLINRYPEIHRDFDITVIADGDGLVSVQMMPCEGNTNVYIEAVANVGSHFVGWYDEGGRLISENEKFMLTEWNQFEDFNDIATYTARFEKN